MTSSAIPGGQAGPLVVRTIALDLDPGTPLLDLLPTDAPVAWLRRGEGLVGWGVAARILTSGPTRFADADKWWMETTVARRGARRGRRAGHRVGLLRQLRLRRRPRRLAADGPRVRRRSPR